MKIRKVMVVVTNYNNEMKRSWRWTRPQDHEDQAGDGKQLWLVATRRPQWQPKPQNHEDHKGNGKLLLVVVTKRPWWWPRPQDYENEVMVSSYWL